MCRTHRACGLVLSARSCGRVGRKDRGTLSMVDFLRDLAIAAADVYSLQCFIRVVEVLMGFEVRRFEASRSRCVWGYCL